MRSNQVLGIIFSNTQDEYLRELTDTRTMGSVPFGGRYRIIDFILSSMVNSGIDKVGVITKSNYQSLLDHLGSGKAWDLSRKREGLFILPPFGHGDRVAEGKVEALASNGAFIRHSREEYIVLSDSDIVFNIDIQKVVDAHIENNADITVVYKNGIAPESMGEKLVFCFDEKGMANDILINAETNGSCNYGLRMYVMNKNFLMDAVSNAVCRNHLSFSRDIIAQSMESKKIYGYQYEGYTAVLGSLKQYFKANMDLLNADIRNELFCQRPVYTKVRDEMPALYGLGSNAKNSLIADGCVIDGEVNNCILFRGVTVAKGARLNNCIVMQDTVIGEDAVLEYAVIDKDAEIRESRKISGFKTYPVYIKKGSIV